MRVVLLCAWLLTISLPALSLVYQPVLPELLLELPPITPVSQPPFSIALFLVLLGVVLLFLLPILLRAMQTRRLPVDTSLAAIVAQQPFPIWGKVAFCLFLVAQIFSATRFRFFAPVQIHTFSMIWYSFILLMEALVVRRGGSPGWHGRKVAYLGSFAVSAGFWWSYEYLNRYLHNWTYHGIEYISPHEYVVFATIAFATVLPAIDVIGRFLETFPRLTLPYRTWIPILLRRPHAYALLFASSAILVAIPVYPNLLFPLVWISPLGILIALQQLLTGTHSFEELRHGDWSQVVKWCCAGLIAGALWEAWNAVSYAHWVYHVPYVQAFHLFEMPLLGYAGYFPFGLLCGAIITALR